MVNGTQVQPGHQHLQRPPFLDRKISCRNRFPIEKADIGKLAWHIITHTASHHIHVRLEIVVKGHLMHHHGLPFLHLTDQIFGVSKLLYLLSHLVHLRSHLRDIANRK